MKHLLVVLLLVGSALGQESTATLKRQATESAINDMPSPAELSALIKKAGEYVARFQEVLSLAKPQLEHIDPGRAAKYSDNAATAENIIVMLTTTGTSGSRLVMLLDAMDTLALDAAMANVQLLTADLQRVASGKSRDIQTATLVLGLTGVETQCYDISELLLNASLRFVAFEDAVLIRVTDKIDGAAKPNR